jgi:CRP/FNR family transcriptional regulator, dissimilatory nitrate respiration regulator
MIVDGAVQLLFGQHPLLAGLDMAAWRAICGGADSVELSAGEVLYEQGGDHGTLYLIVQGTVMLVNAADCSENVGPLPAGEVVGTETLVLGTPYAHTALAASALVALPLSTARLLARLDAGFDQALAMIAGLSASLRLRVKKIADFKMQSTAERLAGYLADLAAVESGPALLHLNCEKRELAERLGMDPATLSRTFAKLRSFGVVADRRDRVTIADVARLRELAAADGLAMEEIA